MSVVYIMYMIQQVTDVIKHVDVLQVHIKDEEFSTEKVGTFIRLLSVC